MTNNTINKIRLVQGNEACALGAIKAGATFYSGYPITPSTEVAEHIANKFPRIGRHFIQMEDEIASIGAAIGASTVGHKAFTATSGPGFSLMQELIGYAAIAEIPVVIINVMRAGPSTGLPTMPAAGDVQQARWGTHGDHSIIAISPNSVMETYYETINAFNLAEQYRTPVLLMMDEKVGHLRERFEEDEANEPVIMYRPAPKEGEKFVPYANVECGVPHILPLGKGERYHITGLTHGETGFYTAQPKAVSKFVGRLSDKIELNVDKIAKIEENYTDDAEVLVLSYGSSARSAHEAVKTLREQGHKVGMVRLITLWPFHDAKIAALCEGKKAVIVPEMNLGQMAREVQRVAKGVPVLPMCRVDGDLMTPDEIIAKVKEVL
ncbi:MAG: 2-oxoacid:acceptor oxidoreductase subunit alpha [Clostridia bacterium]|jgi:2-oxoglutarate ferredoxin oxidoreductase subunit alpha|nr:2-oxoacid:acceptor oxidoreductase subunit alpha [Clostridia bacterium]